MSEVMIRGDEQALPRQPVWERITRFLTTIAKSIQIRRTSRALRLCESLPLGEKRFLALVQVEGQRFLIGVANQSISLLRQLDSESKATNGAYGQADAKNPEDGCN